MAVNKKEAVKTIKTIVSKGGKPTVQNRKIAENKPVQRTRLNEEESIGLIDRLLNNHQEIRDNWPDNKKRPMNSPELMGTSMNTMIGRANAANKAASYLANSGGAITSMFPNAENATRTTLPKNPLMSRSSIVAQPEDIQAELLKKYPGTTNMPTQNTAPAVPYNQPEQERTAAGISSAQNRIRTEGLPQQLESARNSLSREWLGKRSAIDEWLEPQMENRKYGYNDDSTDYRDWSPEKLRTVIEHRKQAEEESKARRDRPEEEKSAANSAMREMKDIVSVFDRMYEYGINMDEFTRGSIAPETIFSQAGAGSYGRPDDYAKVNTNNEETYNRRLYDIVYGEGAYDEIEQLRKNLYGDYVIDDDGIERFIPDEDPESLAKRREEYVTRTNARDDEIEEMWDRLEFTGIQKEYDAGNIGEDEYQAAKAELTDRWGDLGEDNTIRGYGKKIDNLRGYSRQINQTLYDEWGYRNENTYTGNLQDILDRREKIRELTEGTQRGWDTTYHPENTTRFTEGVPIWDSDFWNNPEEVDRIYYVANDTTGNLAEQYGYERSMTEDELKVFNGYYNAGMKDEAYAYFDALKPWLKRTMAQEQEAKNREIARTPFIGPLYGLATVPANIYAGAKGIVGLTGVALGNKDWADPNDPFWAVQRFVSNTRDERAESVNWCVNQLGKKAGVNLDGVGRFCNNVLYSIGDMTAASMVSGGITGEASSVGVQLIMSSEAASATLNYCLAQDMDPSEAVIRAVGTGVIEAVTEKYSIEALLKPDVMGMFGNKRALIKYMAKTVAAESTEEGAGDVLELVLDTALSALYDHETEIMADVNMRMDELAAELMQANPGMSIEDARMQVRAQAEREVWGKWFNDTMLDMAAGGASMLFTAGARLGKNKIRYNRSGQNIVRSANNTENNSRTSGISGNANVDMMLKIGQSMKNGTNSNQIANEIAQKYEEGRKVTLGEIGKLNANIQMETRGQISETADQAIKDTITEKLMDEGMGSRDEAESMADIITKAYTQGIDALNKAERSHLRDSRQGYGIFMELAEQNKQAEGIAKQVRDTVREQTAQQNRDLFRAQLMARGVALPAAAKVGQTRLEAARKLGKVAGAQALNNAEGHRNNLATEAVADGMIGSIAGVKDGKVLVQFEGQENTQEFNPEDVASVNGNAAAIIGYMRSNAGMMSDTFATKALITLENMGEKASNRYADDVVAINLAARLGESMPNISMDKTTAQILYDAAKADMDAADAARTKNNVTLEPGKGTASWDGTQYGTTEWKDKLKTLDKSTRNQAETLAMLAKISGMQLNLYYDDSEEGSKVYGNYHDGVLTLNMGGKNADGLQHHLLVTAGHEVTHYLQENSREGYSALRKFVMDNMRSRGISLEAVITDKMDLYNSFYEKNAKNGETAQKMTIDDAIYEIVADGCSQVLGSQEFANRLKAQNGGLYQKIKGFVQKLIGRWSNAIKGMMSSGNLTVESGGMSLKDIDEMAKIWLGAYDETIHGAVTQEEERQKKAPANNQYGSTAKAYAEAQAEAQNNRPKYSPNTSFSIQQNDADYMKAVKDGDMDAAQQMVDQAAEEAGYKTRAFHGSDALFTQFKPGQRGEMWLSSTAETAYQRKNMYDTYIKMNNPYETTYYVGSNSKFDPVDVTEKGRSGNHDSAIVHWRIDPEIALKQAEIIEKIFPDMKADNKFGNSFTFLPDERIRKSTMKEGETLAEYIRRGTKEDLYQWYTVYNPNQLKSADPVTYDDNGKEIPLSERFNTKKPDIRYSLRQTEDGTIEDSDGTALVQEMPGDVISAYSIRTVDKTVNDDLIKTLVGKGFSEKKVKKWVNDVRGIAKMIADDAQRLDFDALGGTMLKNNQEYVKTLDSSTLCAKRLLYQGIFNEIQHMLPNTPLLPDDLIKLTNMMKKKGLMTPCSICYVESRRRMLGKYASEWLKTYDGAYKPRIEEVTTTDGLEELRESEDPAKRQAAQDFTDAMNAKGSANPKVVQLRSEYRGEIKDMTENQIRKVKEIGGLRVQSFSDFETVHLLDMMQAVMDMAAKDLTSQAYTKVPAFAWVFGGTGIKINLSLIGEGTGLDENGNLKFSSTEGMDINEALKIRETYSKNVGTILVGMNDEHIIAAMGDDRIDFIIPFHKSGWSKKEMALMIGMGTYKDYTRFQNEKKIEGRKADGKGYKTIPNKKSKLTNFQPVGPDGYWDFNKSGIQNAERYLKLCAKDGRMPKFANFLVDNGDGSFSLPADGSERSEKIRKGYWKLLIDFKMYDNDGKGSPQKEVQPKFNMEAARDVLNDYEGGANSLPTNHDVAKEFVDEYKAEHPGKKNFSIRQGPDMDVHQWMMGLNERSLQTEAERALLADYKGRRIAIELAQKRQRDYTEKIRELEKIENPSKDISRRIEGYKIRVQNAKTTEEAELAKLHKIQSSEGYAGMMYYQQQTMNSLTAGRTQDEVNAAVEKMETAADGLKKDIARTTEELNTLMESREVKQARSAINGTTLDQAASNIIKTYNTTIKKKELANEIARIRFKLEVGQNATDDIAALAAQVISNRKGAVRNESLEMLRGVTLKLGASVLKEIYGTDSNMNEIRRMIAGSGVKIEKAGNDGSTLDGNWDELVSFVPALDHYNGIDTDNALNQAKAVAEFVKNAMEEQKAQGKAEYEGQMADVIADLTDNIMSAFVNLPTDPAMRKQFMDLHEYVKTLAGSLGEATKRIEALQGQVDELIKSGRKAATWSRNLKNDIGMALDYFNKTAKLAIDNAKKAKQDAVIQQLKDKHVQEMLKANDEWRNMMQRDRQARHQEEDNEATRRMMNTVVTRLAKLLSAPKGDKNIPEHMQGLARELVETFVDADLFGDGRKLTMLNKKSLGELKRRLNAWKMRDGDFNPADLNAAEDTITWKVEDDLRTIYDAIEEWNGKYNGKNYLDTVRQMGKTLERMQEAVSEIYGIIQAERYIAVKERKILVEDQALRVREAADGKQAKEWTGKVGRAVAGFRKAVISGNMTPEYYFRTLANAGLSELWDVYHEAENRNGLELAKAQAKIADIADRYGYKNWDTKQKLNVQLSGGNVQMTLGQIMSLYATWNREKTLGPEMSQHLEKGGFYVDQDLRDGLLGRTAVEKKAHRVTEGDMSLIGSLLTDDQKNFIDDIVRFMSNDLSLLGNEASMKAYGIKMYKESYYFPFQMWDGIKNRKSNDSGSAAGRDRAFHPSFSKSRMHGANNAIILGDFMQTAADHAVGMINYATMGLANETFQKVLNHTFEEGVADEKTKRNVRAMLEQAYGQEAMSYLRDLQDQLNGGAVARSKSLGDKAISLFRKNAVAGSLSVAAQQPLSYIRAAMMINPKYLAMGLNPATWKGSYKEMMEHSGVAVIKDMGRFDMGFGQSAREYLMPEEKEGRRQKIWEGITDTATKLPEMMDRMTWTRMWAAVKAEQHAENPEMDVKSDEFLDKCGERFNELMRRTQVYDSVLVKSRNMRSDNYWVRSLTSFMAEPTLTANVLMDSLRMAKNHEKGGMSAVGKAGATYILSAVLQAAVKGLMGAGRNPDDKKNFIENLLNRFGNAFISEANPMNLIPGYSDLVTIIKDGKISDDAMGAIGKMFQAGQGTINLLLGTGKSKGTFRDVEDSIGQLVQLFTNLPAKNIMRDARAMWNFFVEKPYAKRETSPAVLKMQAEESLRNADTITTAILEKLGAAGSGTSNKDYMDRIYEARKAGNDQEADEMTEYLTTAKGISEKSINSGMKSRAKKDEDLDAADAADFMAEQDIDPSDYIISQVKDGNMTGDDARKRLKELNPDMDDNTVWWKVDRAEYKQATGKDAGSGKYYRLWDAMDANKAEDIGTAIDTMMAHGVEKKSIKSQITSRYKEAYIKGNSAEKVKIRDAIQKAYKKMGLKPEDADKIINKWK